ncbi:uncharacterized protein LOC108949706 isoform X2 [Ciona intestinalis]
MSDTITYFYLSLGAVGGAAAVISLIVSTAVFWDTKLIKNARLMIRKEARQRDGIPIGLDNPALLLDETGHSTMHSDISPTSPHQFNISQPPPYQAQTPPLAPNETYLAPTNTQAPQAMGLETMPPGAMAPGATAPRAMALGATTLRATSHGTLPSRGMAPGAMASVRPSAPPVSANQVADMEKQFVRQDSAPLLNQDKPVATIRRNLPLPLDPIYASIKAAEQVEEQRVIEELEREEERLVQLAIIQSQPPYTETYQDQENETNRPSTSAAMPAAMVLGTPEQANLGEVPGYQETQFVDANRRDGKDIGQPRIISAPAGFDETDDDDYNVEIPAPSLSLSADIANELEKKVASGVLLEEKETSAGEYVPMKSGEPDVPITFVVTYEEPIAGGGDVMGEEYKEGEEGINEEEVEESPPEILPRCPAVAETVVEENVIKVEEENRGKEEVSEEVIQEDVEAPEEFQKRINDAKPSEESIDEVLDVGTDLEKLKNVNENYENIDLEIEEEVVVEEGILEDVAPGNQSHPEEEEEEKKDDEDDKESETENSGVDNLSQSDDEDVKDGTKDDEAEDTGYVVVGMNKDASKIKLEESSLTLDTEDKSESVIELTDAKEKQNGDLDETIEL